MILCWVSVCVSRWNIFLCLFFPVCLFPYNVMIVTYISWSVSSTSKPGKFPIMSPLNFSKLFLKYKSFFVTISNVEVRQNQHGIHLLIFNKLNLTSPEVLGKFIVTIRNYFLLLLMIKLGLKPLKYLVI